MNSFTRGYYLLAKYRVTRIAMQTSREIIGPDMSLLSKYLPLRRNVAKMISRKTSTIKMVSQ